MKTSRKQGKPNRRYAKALLGALAIAALTVPGARGAGLLIADGGFGGVLEIEEHDVQVMINNGVAVTHVTQVFRNTENRQVEALYTFPVPKGASVSNFSMWINGREMVGEVVEKQRAREIYDSYKQRRKDPGLLEQTDYKTFEMRIFPIGPKAEQKVQISYYQELDFDHDWATYVYPLATITRTNIDQRTKGKFGLNLEVKSEIPINALESPSHGDEFAMAKHTEHYCQMSLETDGGDLSRDFVLAYRLSRPRTGLDLVASRQDGEDGYFLLTLTAGEELAKLQTGMDYVFILDVSGSMNHDGKLRMSRDSIGEFVKILGEGDRFEVVTFNVQAQALFGNLTQPSDDTRERATRFLRDQRGKGGTVLSPAIQAAYKYVDLDRPLNVVHLSDGMTEQRERAELLELIQQRPRGSRVFCIGVGNEVNRPLLEQLAEDAGGLAAFLSQGDNFERQAKAFRRKLMRPVATGLKIALDGAEIYDTEPRQLPNLYHGMPVRMYGRYKKGGPVDVSIRADIGAHQLEKSVTIELPVEDSNNPEIERMWAWHRVQALQKRADRTGSRADVTDAIVQLGEGFSIVTEYTSFLVLENDGEYKRWKIERRNALRLARDRSAQKRLRAELDRLRSQGAEQVGPATEAAATRQLASAANPARQAQPVRIPQTQAPRSRGWDLDLPVGGGALDPFSVGMVVALGGAALASRKKKRTPTDECGMPNDK